MSLSTFTAPSGLFYKDYQLDRFLLPSIHSAKPFFSTILWRGFSPALTPSFSEQPNPTTKSLFTEQWIRLILTYARHRKLFVLRVEDGETAGTEWDEILKNERINRRILPAHLSNLMSAMVEKNVAIYEPPKQTRSILVYWRLPEEWAEILYDWAISTGQLNTILTFLDITDPPVESPLRNIPVSLLRKAISILGKTGRSQIISITDGEGVRFLARAR